MFKTVTACYLNRGQWIDVRDHYGTRKAHEYLFNSIFKLLREMHFDEAFEFDKLNLRMRLLE